MCTADNSGRYTHEVVAEAEGQRKRRLVCSECPLCSWLATQEQKPAIVLANFGSFTTHAVSAVSLVVYSSLQSNGKQRIAVRSRAGSKGSDCFYPGVAQLARAGALGASGRAFESLYSDCSLRFEKLFVLDRQHVPLERATLMTETARIVRCRVNNFTCG